MGDGRENKMKLIRRLGTRKVISKNRKEYISPLGLFLCPYCNKEVEKSLSHGKRDKSCGCNRGKLSGEARTKHGESQRGKHSKLYKTWCGIKTRCYNKNNPSYKDYGGRGIKVYKPWRRSYIWFKKWALANGYKNNLTIDRIKGNGNYEPGNCRWATYTEQNRNKRTNFLIEYKEETHCIAEWAEILEINRYTLIARFRYGWSAERAFTEKVGKYHNKIK